MAALAALPCSHRPVAVAPRRWRSQCSQARVAAANEGDAALSPLPPRRALTCTARIVAQRTRRLSCRCTPDRAPGTGSSSEGDRAGAKGEGKNGAAADVAEGVGALLDDGSKREGPSTDLGVVVDRFWKLALPYWTTESDESKAARWRLVGVVALTLATTGVSVCFNFLSRDFFNALSSKDVEGFTMQLYKWGAAVVVGVPVFVYRDFYQSKLALEWREWMTRDLSRKYLSNRAYYRVQAGALVDNPDQRIAADIRSFTDTSVSLAVVLLNSVVDLVSFSEILYSIYPPLFAALLVYSVGGTVISVRLGRPLVGLNFTQEAREADFRYGLVRVRENAEAIAFYGGEASELRLLAGRLLGVVQNYGQLLIASRNLAFFTGGYRYVIQILPAAVVAPLYFGGTIQFGVINQSVSAFNHILSDVSLIVYQFESLAGFSAVIDRLGEFDEVLGLAESEQLRKRGSQQQQQDLAQGRALGLPEAATGAEAGAQAAAAGAGGQGGSGGDAAVEQPHVAAGAATGADEVPFIRIRDVPLNGGDVLLSTDALDLVTPDGKTPLVQQLSFQVRRGESLLLMGPSGTGKTSLLRAVAGLWDRGQGTITRGAASSSAATTSTATNGAAADEADQQQQHAAAGVGQGDGARPQDVMFVPQRPYMVLGTLRDQLLYPTWSELGDDGVTISSSQASRPEVPTDEQMEAAMRAVRLGPVWQRVAASAQEQPRGSNGNSAGGNGSGGNGSGNGSGGSSPLDVVADWASVLSIGEQQRLAFARVLLTRPSLVLMDESTSALDVANEAALYKQLQESGCAYVSVGHRPTLLDYHSRVLYLSRDGMTSATGGEEQEQGGRETTSWEIKPAAEFKEQMSRVAI